MKGLRKYNQDQFPPSDQYLVNQLSKRKNLEHFFENGCLVQLDPNWDLKRALQPFLAVSPVQLIALVSGIWWFVTLVASLLIENELALILDPWGFMLFVAFPFLGVAHPSLAALRDSWSYFSIRNFLITEFEEKLTTLAAEIAVNPDDTGLKLEHIRARLLIQELRNTPVLKFISYIRLIALTPVLFPVILAGLRYLHISS